MYTLGACVLKSYAFVDHVVFLRAFCNITSFECRIPPAEPAEIKKALCQLNCRKRGQFKDSPSQSLEQRVVDEIFQFDPRVEGSFVNLLAPLSNLGQTSNVQTQTSGLGKLSTPPGYTGGLIPLPAGKMLKGYNIYFFNVGSKANNRQLLRVCIVCISQMSFISNFSQIQSSSTSRLIEDKVVKVL